MEDHNVEMEIRAALQKSLEPGFEIYDFVIVPGKNTFKIKVFLDKPEDPWGTPTVAECESFCRQSDIEILKIAEDGKIARDYILEVSSPGAERVLRNEGEWIRFKDKPMKVKFRVDDERNDTIIANFIRSESGITYWKVFQTKKDRKARKKQEEREIGIKSDDINQVKLYLDF